MPRPSAFKVRMPYVHARLLGSSRRNSEDRAEIFQRGDDLVVVVADGAGGIRGGGGS
jgi:serine/threonine protein phosphatase PrpC